MHLTCPRIILSALRGGSGKTIVTLALMAGWSKKGLGIAPFKKGPDFIDAAWLKEVSGRSCYNLDTFLMEEKTVLSSFAKRTQGADGAVIEGNRGLYDGMDTQGSHSTASLAKLLDVPVILVIYCTKATRTVAALVLGCQKMDPALKIEGVILNQIAGSRHAGVIRSSIEENCKIPVLGEIPKLKDSPFDERHLGLTPPAEHRRKDDALSFCNEIGEKYLDLEGLWKVAREAPPLSLPEEGEDINRREVAPSVRIGVVKDSAFQFYYPENLEELENKGGSLVEINALRDKGLPSVDCLYIGGGFPETHLEELAANRSFRQSLREAVDDNLPVYAECGGAMYLGESVRIQNKTYPMADVFSVVFTLEEKPCGHGYTVLRSDIANPYFETGVTIRGHEFHYSRVEEWKGDKIPFAFEVKRGFGFDGRRDGLVYKNVLSTYTHIHSLGERRWAGALIRRAQLHKENRCGQNSYN